MVGDEEEITTALRSCDSESQLLHHVTLDLVDNAIVRRKAKVKIKIHNVESGCHFSHAAYTPKLLLVFPHDSPSPPTLSGQTLCARPALCASIVISSGMTTSAKLFYNVVLQITVDKGPDAAGTETVHVGFAHVVLAMQVNHAALLVDAYARVLGAARAGATEAAELGTCLAQVAYHQTVVVNHTARVRASCPRTRAIGATSIS